MLVFRWRLVLILALVSTLAGIRVCRAGEVGKATVQFDETSANRLTLDEARSLALSNNKNINLGRVNLQEKQIAISAATTDYLPKLLGSGTYLHFNNDLGTVVATKERQLGGATIGPGGVVQI